MNALKVVQLHNNCPKSGRWWLLTCSRTTFSLIKKQWNNGCITSINAQGSLWVRLEEQLIADVHFLTAWSFREKKLMPDRPGEFSTARVSNMSEQEKHNAAASSYPFSYGRGDLFVRWENVLVIKMFLTPTFPSSLIPLLACSKLVEEHDPLKENASHVLEQPNKRHLLWWHRK